MEEKKNKRYYRIEVGDRIVVNRQEFGDKVFYKTFIKKKFQDGTVLYFGKNLFFKDEVDLADGTTIIVKDFYEDPRTIKNSKFNTNWVLVIIDFEIDEDSNNAYVEYNKSKQDFDINELDNEVPF